MRVYCKQAGRSDSTGNVTEAVTFQMKDTAAFLSLQPKWSERMCAASTRSMENSVDGTPKRVEAQEPSAGSNVFPTSVVSSWRVSIGETGSNRLDSGPTSSGSGVKAVKNRKKAVHGLEAIDERFSSIGEAL